MIGRSPSDYAMSKFREVRNIAQLLEDGNEEIPQELIDSLQFYSDLYKESIKKEKRALIILLLGIPTIFWIIVLIVWSI